MVQKKKKTRVYDSAGSKERIKEAALEIFSKKGFKATTVRDIAAKAEVNIAMIDRYFGGKDSLLESLIEDRLVSFSRLVLSYPNQMTARDEIAMYLKFMTVHVAKDLEFSRMMLIQTLTSPAHSKIFQKLMAVREEQPLYERLRLHKQKGLISKDHDLNQLVSVVSSYLLGLIVGTYFVFSLKEDDLDWNINSFCDSLKI